MLDLQQIRRVFDTKRGLRNLYVTEQCNLDCHYCNEFNNSIPHPALADLKKWMDHMRKLDVMRSVCRGRTAQASGHCGGSALRKIHRFSQTEHVRMLERFAPCRPRRMTSSFSHVVHPLLEISQGRMRNRVVELVAIVAIQVALFGHVQVRSHGLVSKTRRICWRSSIRSPITVIDVKQPG